MRKVYLTERDLELLRSMVSMGFLGTSHIQDKFFLGAARTTVLRRLRLLENQSLVKRILGLESQENLWMVTKKGASKVRLERPKVHWNKNMLEHDYRLLKLRLSLEECGVVFSWMPEHEIRSKLFRHHGPKNFSERIVPDGLLGIQVNGKSESIALELELTLKNQTRIKRTLSRYISKGGVYGVWYVAPRLSILKSVWKIWQLCGGEKCKIKLYCSLLDEILEFPLQARLLGSTPVSKIGESWSIGYRVKGAQGVSRGMLPDSGKNVSVTQTDHTQNSSLSLARVAASTTDHPPPTM